MLRKIKILQIDINKVFDHYLPTPHTHTHTHTCTHEQVHILKIPIPYLTEITTIENLVYTLLEFSLYFYIYTWTQKNNNSLWEWG